jgi:hypothetical protein
VNRRSRSSVRRDPFSPCKSQCFARGEILIAGLQFYPGYKAGTAIYDPTGHLVKQFVLDGDAEIEPAIEVGDARYARAPEQGNEAASRSVAITGDDGFVYLMRSTSPATVYVIPAVAEVIRKIVVRAPTDTGVPDFGSRVAKNRLAVKFNRECDNALIFNSCRGTGLYRGGCHDGPEACRL